jgi:exopolysaccharide biosynthesis polyprenyl glycosylphosphotransferase
MTSTERAYVSDSSRRVVKLQRNRSSRKWLLRTDGASLDRLLSVAPAAKAQGNQWKHAYRRRVLIVDAVVVITVFALAQIAGLVWLPIDSGVQPASWQRLTVFSVILTFAWLCALGLQQSRDIALVGLDGEEYRRVVAATAWVFGTVAVADLLFKMDPSRGYLGIALGLGSLGLITGRHFVRRDLARRRLRGEYISRVVVLGSPEAVRVLCETFGRTPDSGYRVVGVCIPDFDGEVGEELITTTGSVPVLGDDSLIESALDLTSADALAVAAVERLGPTAMKKLVWRLEALNTDVIVVPGVTDIAGHRLRVRPIDNLPLVQIAHSGQDAPSAMGKRFFDLAFATLALLAVAPIMLVAAVAIKLDDGGPVIFRQERVGLQGRSFRIFKFRTMTTDADSRKDSEQAASNNTGVFYKSATDSRITRVGRFLRVSSIDELPQLLNVLQGAMSIVGPRPLVRGEGEAVEDFVERRGRVKPGITGLWQISGRSDLSEQERIRLDHSYVDNWSSVLDLLIVWRTVAAVLKRKGAY